MTTTVDTEGVRRLLDEGAHVVEVLPTSDYEREHLPGAVSIPLPEMRAETVADLDRNRPVITYCYDYQCDLSSRAAALLSSMGFAEVYDYMASKAAWLAYGLPSEGTMRSTARVGQHTRKVATVTADEVIGALAHELEGGEIVVVLDGDVVIGVVRKEVLALPPDTRVCDVMQTGAPSVRPSITTAELAKSMDKQAESWVLVTALDGSLLGIARREDLDAA